MHHHRLFAALMPDFFAQSSRRILYTVVSKYLSSMSVSALCLSSSGPMRMRTQRMTSTIS